jgi:hypothetical protein
VPIRDQAACTPLRCALSQRGVILAALSVQFVVDGIKSAFNLA